MTTTPQDHHMSHMNHTHCTKPHCLTTGGCKGACSAPATAACQHGQERDRCGFCADEAPAAPVAQPASWISVEDRLPKPDSGEVLVWLTGGRHAFDEWHTHREDPTGMSNVHTLDMGTMWRDYEFEEITHWMPLPLPPAPGTSAPAPMEQGGPKRLGSNRKIAQLVVLMDMADDYATRAAAAHAEALYGTSASYTKQCHGKSNAARSELHTALQAALAAPSPAPAPQPVSEPSDEQIINACASVGLGPNLGLQAGRAVLALRPVAPRAPRAPLTEGEIDAVVEDAHRSLRRYQSGVRGQQITQFDGIEAHVVRATERALSAMQPAPRAPLTDEQIADLMPPADGTAEANVVRLEVLPGVMGTEFEEVDAWSRELVIQTVRAALNANGIGQEGGA